MKKDFDFDDIGKKTPYRVPEGFLTKCSVMCGNIRMVASRRGIVCG